VIRRIYSLARPSDSRFEAGRSGERDAALALMEGEMRQRSVSASTMSSTSSTEVDGDPVLLEQALLNLLRNAIESMRDTPPNNASLPLNSRRAEGYALLDDRRSGLRNRCQRRRTTVFDPLFTTKAGRHGHGFGNLPFREWKITGVASPLRPTPKAGTVFRILLPIVRPQ
jgi:two-component system sensor histidine kinase DctS